MLEYKLVAFDLDGTLLQGEPSWSLLHRYFGTLDKAEKAHEMYIKGEISYEQFMYMDLSSWPKPLHRSTLESILLKAKLRPEAKYVVDKLKRAGMKIAIVTAALDLLANRIGKLLNVDFVYSNKIGFDERGYYNGKVYPLVEPLKKDLVLKSLASNLSIDLKNTIAVGDNVQDESFLRIAGLSFVIGDRKLARKIKAVYIKDLREILDYLEL